MLILEGPDRIGKSTAARQILKLDPSWHSVHMTKPKDDFAHFEDYMKLLQPKTVYDRFHLGALVYGNLTTEELQRTDRELLAMTARAIRFLGSQVVVLYSSCDTWLSAHVQETSEEELYEFDTILRVNRVFRWLATMGVVHQASLFGTILVDVAHDVAVEGWPSEAQLQLWMEWAHKRQASVAAPEETFTNINAKSFEFHMP